MRSAIRQCPGPILREFIKSGLISLSRGIDIPTVFPGLE